MKTKDLSKMTLEERKKLFKELLLSVRWEIPVELKPIKKTDLKAS